MSSKFNLSNVLDSVITLMEIAEEMYEIDGKQRKDYVHFKMEKKLGMLYNSYKYEIETIIESVIYITNYSREIMINENKKKDIFSCLKFTK